MIFRHYRRWMRNLVRSDGAADRSRLRPAFAPAMGTSGVPQELSGRIHTVFVVEAGGIEPPSEGASAIASTCVARALLSPRSLPQAGSRAASRRCVSAPAPPAVAGTQPEVMTLEPALRAQAGRAWRPN